jgi:AbrB family looped-hinge helix DNA binding protein
MKLAQSKLTAQGQISVPAEVRKKLGVGPGAVIEWIEEDGKLTVRRAGRATWDDVHKAAFPNGPPKYIADPRKAGVAAYVRRRYGRRRHAGD